MKLTIKFKREQGAAEYQVLYNSLLSHQISAARMENLAKLAEADLWKANMFKVRELGEELFSVLDGTGGKLAAEMEKARGQELFRYLSMGKTIAEAVMMARQEMRDSYGTWALFRVYSDASPTGAMITSGMGVRTETFRKTVHRMLGNTQIKVLEQGFIGRRRQIQQGVKVLRGYAEQKGLLITGAAGVEKSCLAGKLMERFPDKIPLAVHGRLNVGGLHYRGGDS